MKNVLKYVAFISLSALLVFIDQLTKLLAVNNLYNKDNIVLIDNILELVYVENRGAAFGILQNKQIFFYILTIVVLAVILLYVYKIPFTAHYLMFLATLSFIFAGAVGNFIDRLRNQYVVDFIYFKPIDFPVFNFADICITIGCVMFAFSLIFIYKGEEI